MPHSEEELQEYLWEAIQKLRHHIPVDEYQKHLIPLLYYKIASDESDLQDGMDSLEGETEHVRSQLPYISQENRWHTIQELSSHYGEGIDTALAKLPETPLSPATAFDPEFAELGRDHDLSGIVDHLGSYQLDHSTAPPEELGPAFDSLLTKITGLEGKRGGFYSTPPSVRRLCARIAGPISSHKELHDPTVGVGGILVEASNELAEEPSDGQQEIRLTGQELNRAVASVANLNLILHGLKGDIRLGDSLADPKFTTDGELERFDYVFSDFPMSMSWPKDELEPDPFNRFNKDGGLPLPRADRGDYAFILHSLSQLKKPGKDGSGGKSVLVVPHGVLYRRPEAVYREYLIEQDYLESVIGLPTNLYHHHSVPVALLVLNTQKPSERQNRVKIIHAMEDEFYENVGSTNKLTENGIEQIVNQLSSWQTGPNDSDFTQTISTSLLRDRDYSLNPSKYIQGVQQTTSPGLGRELQKIDSTSYTGAVSLPDEPEFNDILGKMMEISENTVYVLGSYTGANLAELIDIKNELEEMGYDAHLDEDLPDFPTQDLSGSVATTMRLAGFCVMIDREASGHIDEYRLAEKQRTILARLTPEDGGSTRMIGGAELVDVNYIKSFEFNIRPQEVLDEAVEWATEVMKERKSEYSDHYDWRD